MRYLSYGVIAIPQPLVTWSRLAIPIYLTMNGEIPDLFHHEKPKMESVAGEK
jgi:hypothetical protein